MIEEKPIVGEKKQLSYHESYHKKNVCVMAIIIALIIIIGIGLSVSTPNDSSGNDYGNTDDTSQSQSTYVCYYDWKADATTHIGDYYEYSGEYLYEAPSGYAFLIATIYVENHASESVSTSPVYWELYVSGVIYNSHVSTYDDSINSASVTVTYGGSYTFQVVYLIPQSTPSASLVYDGYNAPTMERDDSLIP